MSLLINNQRSCKERKEPALRPQSMPHERTLIQPVINHSPKETPIKTKTCKPTVVTTADMKNIHQCQAALLKVKYAMLVARQTILVKYAAHPDNKEGHLPIILTTAQIVKEQLMKQARLPITRRRIPTTATYFVPKI